MVNPSPLSIIRSDKFVIPAEALRLTGTNSLITGNPDFEAPVYWRRDKRNSTSGVIGLSHYFDKDKNTGDITIDISQLGTNENRKVYFMYTDTVYLVIIPVTWYKFASATLKELIEATTTNPLELPFALNLI